MPFSVIILWYSGPFFVSLETWRWWFGDRKHPEHSQSKSPMGFFALVPLRTTIPVSVVFESLKRVYPFILVLYMLAKILMHCSRGSLLAFQSPFLSLQATPSALFHPRALYVSTSDLCSYDCLSAQPSRPRCSWQRQSRSSDHTRYSAVAERLQYFDTPDFSSPELCVWCKHGCRHPRRAHSLNRDLCFARRHNERTKELRADSQRAGRHDADPAHEWRA